MKDYSFLKQLLMNIDSICFVYFQISDLPIHSKLKTILNEKGFHNLTPVQKMTIPKLLEGQGIHLITQTGTGKTLSYIISLLNMAHEFKAENETKTKVRKLIDLYFVLFLSISITCN